MSECLIRTVDKINIDSRQKNAACTKRGDVIVIVDDNWPWTAKEINSPQHTIKKFPGIDKDDLSGFLAPEPGTFDSLGRALDPYLQRRFSFLDLSVGLPARPTLTQVLDTQRTKPIWSDRDP